MSEQQDAVDDAMRELGMLPLAARDRKNITVITTGNHSGTTVTMDHARDVLRTLYAEGLLAGVQGAAVAIREAFGGGEFGHQD